MNGAGASGSTNARSVTSGWTFDVGYMHMPAVWAPTAVGLPASAFRAMRLLGAWKLAALQKIPAEPVAALLSTIVLNARRFVPAIAKLKLRPPNADEFSSPFR